MSWGHAKLQQAWGRNNTSQRGGTHHQQQQMAASPRHERDHHEFDASPADFQSSQPPPLSKRPSAYTDLRNHGVCGLADRKGAGSFIR